MPVQNLPPSNAALTDLDVLLTQYPERAIVLFLSYTTSNSKDIAPHLSSLLAIPTKAKVFPISIRYMPSDVTTQVLGGHLTFL